MITSKITFLECPAFSIQQFCLCLLSSYLGLLALASLWGIRISLLSRAVQPLMPAAFPNACNPESDTCAWDSVALPCSGAVGEHQKLQGSRAGVSNTH